MTEHLSIEVVERFHQQVLRPGDKSEIYQPIIVCEPCRKRIVTPRVEEAALTGLLEQFVGERDGNLIISRLN